MKLSRALSTVQRGVNVVNVLQGMRGLWVAVLLAGLAALVPALPDTDWTALMGGDAAQHQQDQDGVSALHREYDKVSLSPK